MMSTAQPASRSTITEVLALVGGIFLLILVVESFPAWVLIFGGVLFWQAGWLVQIAPWMKFWPHGAEQTGLSQSLELLKPKRCQSAFQGACEEETAQKSRQEPSALTGGSGEELAESSSWQRWGDRGKLRKRKLQLRKASIVSPDASIKESLVSKIKTFQRFDEEMNHAWCAFCESHVGKKRDPSCYPVDVLQQFLEDHVTLKDLLVAKIKELQSCYRGNKHAWWTFCESQEGKNRDPARFPVEVLQQFVKDHLGEEITLSQSSTDPCESRSSLTKGTKECF